MKGIHSIEHWFALSLFQIAALDYCVALSKRPCQFLYIFGRTIRLASQTAQRLGLLSLLLYSVIKH